MRRIDYKLIEDLVPHGSTVLDLACGDGELLSQLIRDKGVRGSGVDVSQEAVEACVRKGLSVFHGDLDAGLADFAAGIVPADPGAQAGELPELAVGGRLQLVHAELALGSRHALDQPRLATEGAA